MRLAQMELEQRWRKDAVPALCAALDITGGTTAVDIYREAKQKYGAQYAIWDDLVLFNLHGVQMTARFCEPSVARARASQGKLHADRSLLVHVEREDDSDELLGDPPDLNYDADTPLFYEPRYAQIAAGYAHIHLRAVLRF